MILIGKRFNNVNEVNTVYSILFKLRLSFNLVLAVHLYNKCSMVDDAKYIV